jgi:hypothetical protein
VYFREAACGHNRAAYFIGKRCIICSVSFCCASAFQLLPQPFFLLPHAAFCAAFRSILVCSLSLFSTAISLLFYLLLRLCFHIVSSALIVLFLRHILATPRTSVSWAVSIIIANVWCIYGLSCLSSMIVSRKNAIMLAVVLCMIPAALCVPLVFLFITSLMLSTMRHTFYMCGYGPSLNQASKWNVKWFFDVRFRFCCCCVADVFYCSCNIHDNEDCCVNACWFYLKFRCAGAAGPLKLL